MERHIPTSREKVLPAPRHHPSLRVRNLFLIRRRSNPDDPLTSIKATALLLACLALLAAMNNANAAAQGRRDPSTGRIRVLYIGDAILTHNPVYIYKSDPTFSTTLIPACRDDLLGQGLKLSDINRYMREYMPRTFDQMKDSYDMIILSDSCVLNFRPHQIEWMGRCVQEEGLGLAMIGGYESFAGHSEYPSWVGTAVADSLPVEFGATPKDAPSGSYKVVVASADDEFMRSLPWDPAPTFFGLNLVSTRMGASELAKAGGQVLGSFKEYPLMVAWRCGKGRTIAFTSDWTPSWGAEFAQWEYYLDFAANLAMYGSRVTVPQNLALVHSNRERFFALSTEKTLLASVFDFIQQFGANPAKLEERLEDVDQAILSARDAFIKEDYQQCLSLLNQAGDTMKQIELDAIKLKQRAMMWIYVIEWSAVLGTSLLCGVTLWLIMVRRSLYREVHVTRSEGR